MAATNDERIRGVLAPVVTPFKVDLSPDPQRFIRHCQWLLSQSCGLAVFGTTSEANSLAAKERSTLLDDLVAAGVEPSRMMPGTGCCSITETVKLTTQAVKHGCAGVLMLPPFYYKEINEEGLYRYFGEVVQRVADARLKIYLYHIPPVAIVGITPKLVERLLKSYPDTIAGMKDSSGDWNNTKTFLDAFAVRARDETSLKSQTPSSKSQGSSKIQHPKVEGSFDIFVGSESFLLANMLNGGAGTITATANVNPAAIHELYAEANAERPTPNIERRIKNSERGEQAADPPSSSSGQTSTYVLLRRDKTARLESLQAKLNAVREIFGKKFPMIAAVKQAIAIYSNDPEWARVRPPLVELTAEQTRALESALNGVGFTMKTD